ncbi:MAG: hypothetical protein IT443_10720 [Phycisphaeraceae bacterium]|nr:hypothetical protein [Phycisphaeraceae bacterium]
MPADDRPEDKFGKLAEQRNPGIVHEFMHFLAHQRKWWLWPIVAVLLLAGLLVVLGGGGGISIFIYTLF